MSLDNYTPMKDNVLLINRAECGDISRYNSMQIYRKLDQLIDQPKGNPYVQLQAWRKLGVEMRKFLALNQKSREMALKQLDRYTTAASEKSHQRWTPDEDELLIEFVCREPTPSIHEVSTIFGRTPAAIAQRVTKLVGKSQIEKSVAGRFIGTMDGVEVDGYIEGVVRKGK